MSRIVRRLLAAGIASCASIFVLSACFAGPQPEPPTVHPGVADAAGAGSRDGGAGHPPDAALPPSAGDAGVATTDAGRSDDSAWDLDPSGFAAGENSRSGGGVRWVPPGPGQHLLLPDAGDESDAGDAGDTLDAGAP